MCVYVCVCCKRTEGGLLVYMYMPLSQCERQRMSRKLPTETGMRWMRWVTCVCMLLCLCGQFVKSQWCVCVCPHACGGKTFTSVCPPAVCIKTRMADTQTQWTHAHAHTYCIYAHMNIQIHKHTNT